MKKQTETIKLKLENEDLKRRIGIISDQKNILQKEHDGWKSEYYKINGILQAKKQYLKVYKFSKFEIILKATEL